MLTLMVVDSSDIVRKVAKRILSALNFDVLEAENADNAVAECFRNLPNVVIIDGHLEGAQDVITHIRSMPNGDQTRVYYCVIEADLKTMMAGRRAGADDFLQKPFDRQILTEKLGPIAAAA